MRVTSRVGYYGGVPTLWVNDKPQVGMAYITYFEERNRYRDFAEAGYKLYSFATFFGDQTINECSHFHPLSRGIFAEKGKSDYSEFDRSVTDILEACPEAMIFPRVNMSLPRWWELEHPEECHDTGTQQYPDVRRACFSSKLWRAQSEVFLRQLIAHVEASPWREHIVGYQIACGQTEEWFSFDMKGGVGEATRRAFAEAGGEADDKVAFRRFLSEQAAGAIAYLAGVVKEATQRRLAVGAFYGYTLETPWWSSNHMAVRRLLSCGEVDFLCSPISYMNTRAPGQDWPCMGVLDSLLMHGKMYFAELDTRTHLSRFPGECRENSVEPGTYEQAIWLGPKSPEVSRWMLRQNIGRQLTHGYSSWWFDMWGGWYATPEMMQEVADLRKLAARELANPHRQSIAEAAVFVDETCYALLEENERAVSMRVCYHNRKPLGLCGVPYAIYEISDFEAVIGRLKAAVFLAPAMTPAVEAAVARCRQAGIPCLLVDREAEPLNTAVLRRFYGEAGVHCWCDSDDVIYASRSLLVIHASSAGVKRIRLPQRRRVTPELPAGEAFCGEEIAVELQQYETRIFRLND